MEAVVTVRRRRRAKAFQCEDLLFVVEFKQSATAGNLRLLSVLMTVYSSILELVRKLKVYFDDKKKRYCFFSCSVDGMTSSIYTGAQDLHNEPEDQIANAVL